MGKRKCRNCPDKPVPIKVIPFPKGSDSARLWQQAIFTAHSVIEMMTGYSLLGVGGEQIPQLRRLSERLNQVIKNCEERK